MKEGRIFFGVLGFTLLALVAAMFIPQDEKRAQVNELPWQITPTAEGSIQVFDITLGNSTLLEVERKLRHVAVVNLFIRLEDGAEKPVIEAFFERVELAGLGAQVVVTFDIAEADLLAMFERGVRIAKMGSGERKVDLAGDDLAVLYQTPIATLTYLPKINLSSEMILNRFGQPLEQIAEPEGGAVHWLYPEKGLDLLLSDERKEVLQYLPPRDFDRLLQPLREKGERIVSPEVTG